MIGAGRVLDARGEKDPMAVTVDSPTPESDAGTEETGTPSPPETTAPVAATSAASTLIALAESGARAAGGLAAAIGARRGMPLALAGGIIVALAWLSERNTAWGFPMLIAGAAMIGLGLLGPRLSGSMALRWGEDGAFFQLTSAVAPPGRRHRAPELEDPEPADDRPAKLIPPGEVQGEAETIDFNVEALKAGLIATAEE